MTDKQLKKIKKRMRQVKENCRILNPDYTTDRCKGYWDGNLSTLKEIFKILELEDE